MSVDDYRWHYDYPRLAWDSGFTFHTNRFKALDKNMGFIDVEQVIRERDVAAIEKNIGTVLGFSLDNDQTSVLDPSFVKIFRLSQLSVQYLLFCKKYLDNTVVLMKKEFIKNNEEAKNLKQYVEELKQETSNYKKQIKGLKSALNCQIASTQNVPGFQCNECPKAFSTEEYLLAHIKRRHGAPGNVGVTTTSFQAETDKLQLEIKELKERLNNTEKFIQNDDVGKLMKHYSASNLSTKNNSTENVLLADLQQKFELLKNHVENELRLLQTQKFDQEKYEKWFDTFLRKLEHSHHEVGGNVNNNNNVFGAGDNQATVEPLGVKGPLNEHRQSGSKEEIPGKKTNTEGSLKDLDTIEKNAKGDISTQTDFVLPVSQEQTVCKNCQARLSITTNPKQVDQQRRGSFSDGENKQQKILSEAENHMDKFEEMIQEKVTGSIEKLENQMQSFWTKMNEMEKQKLPSVDPVKTPNNNSKSNSSIETIDTKSPKVIPKPRKTIPSREAFKSTATLKKLNKPQIIIKSNFKDAKKTIQMKPVKSLSTGTITFKESLDSDSDSDTCSKTSEESASSESSDAESDDEKPAPMLKPSTTSTLGQRSLTSLKEAAFTPEVLQGLQKEVENILNSRLEELGVSPEWTHLPVRSYQRALDIVTHQASLIHKNVANYMRIRGQIVKNVDRQALEGKKAHIAPPKHSKLKNLLSNVKNKAKNIVQNDAQPTNTNKSINKTKRTQLEKQKLPKPQVEEKVVENNKEEKPKSNPRMYASDTESNSSINRKISPFDASKITDQTQRAYFNVIQELNTAVNTKIRDHKESTSEIDSPVNQLQPIATSENAPSEDDNNSDIKVETHAKGVLKNYPSVGSLQKKKVLFDLESSDASVQKEPVKPSVVAKTNEDGSTTSIASSILDGTKTHVTQESVEKKQNELSDFSDWDLSEILD